MLDTYRKLFEMMSPRERRRFWLLIGITFFLSLLEAGSVISILPFLRLVAEPSLIQTIPTLQWLYDKGGFESDQSFLFWAGILIFFVTIIGLALKMVTIWLTTRFALLRAYSFSSRLLTKYLHQPYEWFLARHSADLGNAILSEVDRVVYDALLPAMRIIPDTFTVVLLIAALCVMEPEIALAGSLLLGGMYAIIYLFVRRSMTRIGEVRLAANRQRFHIVQEATGGVKELKIIGLEQPFLHRFQVSALRMARAMTWGQIMANIPRQGIEAVAFGGMIALILFLLIKEDGEIAAVVPTLGFIAAIGLRMIPALQQIYSKGTSLKQSEATLERIHADLTGLALEPQEDRIRRAGHKKIPLTDRLVLSDVHYSYPESERSALNGMSMEFPANTSIGIVGGTGAGKTTLVDIMLGLLVPHDGEFRIDGTTITDENRRAWQKTIGYVPQVIFLSDGTVAENIAFGIPKEDINMAAIERAARIAALHDFVMQEMPDGYDTMVGERGVRLSGGQRQRIGIARALYHDPSTLILDEATSALDTLTEADVMKAVHEIAGSKTIIMIAHRLSTIRQCDTIFLLRNGQVAAQGKFDELVEADAEFRKMSASVTAASDTATIP